jgi:hypothetical protein
MPPSAARSHLPRTPSKPDTEFPRRTLLGSSLNKAALVRPYQDMARSGYVVRKEMRVEHSA